MERQIYSITEHDIQMRASPRHPLPYLGHDLLKSVMFRNMTYIIPYIHTGTNAFRILLQ